MPAWSCYHSLYVWICSGFSAAWYARILCLIPIASRTSLMRLSLQVRSFFLIPGVLTFQIIVIPHFLSNWTPDALHFILVKILYKWFFSCSLLIVFCAPTSTGDLKSTKAYDKWSKKVSKTKPPTSPLRQRKKSVLFLLSGVLIYVS